MTDASQLITDTVEIVYEISNGGEIVTEQLQDEFELIQPQEQS